MIDPVFHQLSRTLEQYFREEKFPGKLPGVLPLSKRFGVSKTTISRALHVLQNRGLLTINDTCGMVFHDHQPGPVPKSHIIGIEGLCCSTYTMKIIERLNSEYRKTGFTLMEVNLSSIKRNIDWILQMPLDGIILLNSGSQPRLLDFLYDHNIPVIGSTIPGYEHLTGIEPDHYQGYCRILNELKALGHRRIGLTLFEPEKPFGFYFQEILRAFRDILFKDFDEKLIYHPCTCREMYERVDDTHTELAREAFHYFKNLPSSPTAVIAEHNIICGLNNFAYKAKVRVPGDLSLYSVCYPGSCDPFYHTAVVRDDLSAKIAFRRMISMLSGKNMKAEQILVPMSFNEGRSIASVRS